MTKPDRLGVALLLRALNRPAGTPLPDDPLDLLTHEDRMAIALHAQARRLAELEAELQVEAK